jgi:hypothetical protein
MTFLLERLLGRAGSTASTIQTRASLAARGERAPRTGSTLLAGLLGAAGGAASAFLLDRARGRARRARLLDQAGAGLRRLTRRGGQVVGRARSEVGGRLAAARAARTADPRPLDDATLTDRVQSIVFRDASVPKGRLNVNVERGIVVLRGEVTDDATRSRLIAAVEEVDGVWSVRDLLHLPGEEPVSVAS